MTSTSLHSLPTGGAGRPEAAGRAPVASRFATLMRREWLQHGRAYLLLALIPAGLLLIATVLSWNHMEIQPAIPVLGMAISALGITGLIVAIVCVAVLFKLPGLAQRDVQDRSIEFWSSLPVTHTQCVAAPLVVHGLLMPLLALAIGFVASQVIGVLVVVAATGAASMVAMPWGMLIVAELAGVLRFALGLLLAALWIAPVPLLLMVASAGLKRWGVPVLAAVLLVGGLVLEKVYGITVLHDVFNALWQHAGRAFITHPPTNGNATSIEQLPAMLGQLPPWAAEDALGALRDLLTPAFAASLAASAACFAALVALRRRAAAG
jgi:hypothetical protein